MKKGISCKTGLKKNVISKSIFEREIFLCKELSKDKKGCGWGKCQDCGVVPLLYKLHNGTLIEKESDIAKLKNNFLK
ncbi:MAG: hypothetical protein WC823_00910 [Parcubacteria group bacterium]|jgi:hypothetical protein